jgi:hypothetical protein
LRQKNDRCAQGEMQKRSLRLRSATAEGKRQKRPLRLRIASLEATALKVRGSLRLRQKIVCHSGCPAYGSSRIFPMVPKKNSRQAEILNQVQDDRPREIEAQYNVAANFSLRRITQAVAPATRQVGKPAATIRYTLIAIRYS